MRGEGGSGIEAYSSKDEESLTIGIFAHAGTGNLGDEAIIASTIQNLRERCPSVGIVGFTVRPDDTARRHGIPAYPIRRQASGAPHSPGAGGGGGTASAAGGAGAGGPARPGGWRGLSSRLLAPRLASMRRWIKSVPWLRRGARAVRAVPVTVLEVWRETAFLLRSFRHLGGVDLLVVAGSGQLNDEWAGGAWGFPYTIFKWTLLARLRGARVAFVSVGSSELRSRLSKFFIGTALRSAAYRSFRNQGSKVEMARLGLRVADDPVLPDLVFSIRLPAPAPDTGSTRTGPGRVVAINAMPLPDGYSEATIEDPDYLRYLQALTGFSEWLLERGYAVAYLPTQIVADPPALARVRQGVRVYAGGGGGRAPAAPAEVSSITTLEELVGELRRADYVVATRFHGALLPLVLEKPVLAIAYHRKSRELLESVGQSDQVIDWRHCELEALQSRFLELERARAARGTFFRPEILRFRAALELQYDELIAVARSR